VGFLLNILVVLLGGLDIAGCEHPCGPLEGTFCRRDSC